MPANIQVKARVIDLTKDRPSATDEFFVDSNVWIAATYGRITNPAVKTPQHQFAYSTYLANCINIGAKLYACTITFVEMAAVIERFECQIFGSLKDVRLDVKEYRHNEPAERQNMSRELLVAWKQVLEMGTLVDVNLGSTCIEAIVRDFPRYTLDAHDHLLLEILTRRGITSVVSDDMDFSTVPGLNVFTANPTVLNAARRHRMLETR